MSDSAAAANSRWSIQTLPGVGPDQFIALRGLAPDFYTGLLHSSAAAEYGNSLEKANHSAEWTVLLLAPEAGEQLDVSTFEGPNFLQALDKAYSQLGDTNSPQCPETKQVLPFASGWQLYLSYELAAQVEPVLQPALVTDGGIVAQARRVRGALLYNHLQKRAWCCVEQNQPTLAQRVIADLASINEAQRSAVTIKAVYEAPAEQFTEAVERIHRYVKDGDVFQVNLSRGWQLEIDSQEQSENIYRQLSCHNPAPFSAWLSVAGQENGFELISSSPERLVAIQDAEEGGLPWVNTRPIAGTRPRGEGEPKNQQYLQELQQSPKENAEHLMLIDLERNDLGRVCVPGSIEVNELMCIESFAHVHHIVSNVRGRKRSAASVGDVIAAVFPGGTITGCPKVRCMEIIAELEQCPRGAYTGAVGYLGLDGHLDLNIVIRSLVRPNANPETLLLRAGAGIVADSNPQHELLETRAKANSVLRAFGAENASKVAQ